MKKNPFKVLILMILKIWKASIIPASSQEGLPSFSGLPFLLES